MENAPKRQHNVRSATRAFANFLSGKRVLELRASLRLFVAKILLDFKSELGILPPSAPNSRNQSKFYAPHTTVVVSVMTYFNTGLTLR